MLHRAAIFYADDSLVASTDLVWMQGLFNALNRFFGRLGIRKCLGIQSGYSASAVARLVPS